jgi:restriction system protein
VIFFSQKNISQNLFNTPKGIGSSKLVGVTSIQPILTINRNDKGFVESHNIAHTIDESTNRLQYHGKNLNFLIEHYLKINFLPI